jgi:hypothetical protein
MERLAFNLAAIGRDAGWAGDDFALYASAILAAQRELGRRAYSDDVVEKLATLGERLRGRGGEHDGLAYAAEWISELTEGPLPSVAALQTLQSQVAREVDTDHARTTLSVALQVLDGLFATRHLGMAPALSTAVLEMLDIHAGEQVLCAFPMTAPIALQAAQQAEVAFFVGDPVVSMVTALLGVATGAKLTVDRRDPLSGAYMGHRRWGEFLELPWCRQTFDHLVAFPPMGVTYELGGHLAAKRSVAAEQLQFMEMGRAWSKTMVTIVSDGFLSRSASADVMFRRGLTEQGLAAVTSLPPGVWGRSSGLQTSLVEFRRGERGNICFVDGRTLGTRRARASSSELSQHLTELPSIIAERPDRVAAVGVEELDASQFNLAVDRYVKSPLIQRMEATLQRHQVASLGDIAEIVRPQAAKPLRGDDEGGSFEVLEITTSDIENGTLNKPERRARFGRGDWERVMKSAVTAGDLVISVKGKVGVVGVVPEAADLARSGEPWVISQSFAILRLRKAGPIDDARVLGAILSAPWAEERLRRLAGGTTVPMISMSDLREFTIPIPDPDTLEDVAVELDKLRSSMLTVVRMNRKIQQERQKIWSQLWDMPITDEDDVDA